MNAETDRVGSSTQNAEQVAELLASRARIVADADEQRRRLQRELHDGAQQRLVHAVIVLKMARSSVDVGSAAAELVEEALINVERASSDLREVVHRLLPRSLIYGGLHTGLTSLVGGLAVPVDLQVDTPRLPPALETTAYVVVAEAMTDAVEQRHARRAEVSVELVGDSLVVEVRDDSVSSGLGAALTSLRDRVGAARGSLTVTSTPGKGTTVRAELPADASA